jgi:acyl-CoA thioesterase-1
MRPFRGVFSWLPLLLVCLIVAACGGGVDSPAESPRAAAPARAPEPAATKARPKVVALGDSLTAGLGLVESQSYPAILQQRIDAGGYGFEVVNAGVSGDTSAGGVRRLDWALDGDVKVLILALGANDGLRGRRSRT